MILGSHIMCYCLGQRYLCVAPVGYFLLKTNKHFYIYFCYYLFIIYCVWGMVCVGERTTFGSWLALFFQDVGSKDRTQVQA